MIAALTGLREEANTITDQWVVQVLTGLAAINDMDGLIPSDCEAIISWGTAGALTSDVKVGDVVAVQTVFTPDGAQHKADADWLQRIVDVFPEIKIRRGFSSSTEVAATAVTKASLAAKYPVSTVDMGAYAVAAFAEKRGISWAVIQGISDAYDQDIVKAAQDGMGGIEAVIKDLVADPTELRGLVTVTETFTEAIYGLQRCYFALGPELGEKI
jgi:adenosylhomocysteine nucleosidase